MSEYRSRAKLNMDMAKLKKSGMNPRKTQEEILHFFMDKGFTYHRNLGYIYDRELAQEEWTKITAEMADNDWFQCINNFDIDLIGEPNSLLYLFRKPVETERRIGGRQSFSDRA